MKNLKSIQKITLSILTIFALAITSCSKDNDEPAPIPVSGPTVKDIYACGNIGNRAVFWKNGVESFLTDGTESASANKIIVNGTDIYVAGSEENAAEVKIAKVWKNGDATNLTSEINAGDDIRFDMEGSNTYVVGKTIAITGRNAIAIWKNNVKTVITDGTKNAVASDINVVGNDVYVLGYESSSVGVNVYKIWKNGIVMTILTDGSTTERATKLRVFGNDVYVLGATSKLVSGLFQSQATIWKNGIRNFIGTTPSIYLEDVTVIGSDVYLTGYEFETAGSIAKVWKNGIATSLTSGTTLSKSFSIIGFGNDVYVSGFEKQGSSNEIGKIWKNGVVLSSFNNPTFGVSVKSFFLTTN